MDNLCSVKDCVKKTIGLGYCSKHYTRYKRYGDVNGFKEIRKTHARKINFKENTSGCLEITSHKPTDFGYSEIMIKGVTKKIHRHVFEQMFGEIPVGLVIRHKCDNPRCINPEHLETGTHFDNVQDSVKRGRHAKGSRKPLSKLNEIKVIEIKKMILKGSTNKELAAIYGVDNSIISEIRHNKAWKHVKLEDYA